MNTQELATSLRQFTGTENYYRVYPKLVITDGVRYLASTASCYWLITAIYSYLPRKAVIEDFVVATLNVTETRAELVIDDGNGNVIAKQAIEYTDFPLPKIKLYCVFENDCWVLLLPSEY
jgi:hypothetical protein